MSQKAKGPELCLALLFFVISLFYWSGCGRKRQIAPGVEITEAEGEQKITITNEKGQQATIEGTASEKGSGQMTITTPEGEKLTATTGAQAVREQDVGIAFYPGATIEEAIQTTGSSGAPEKTSWSNVTLLSADTYENVASFYRDRYAKGNTVVEQPDQLMIIIKTGEQAGKMILVSYDSEIKKVRIMISATAQQSGSQ